MELQPNITPGGIFCVITLFVLVRERMNYTIRRLDAFLLLGKGARLGTLALRGTATTSTAPCSHQVIGGLACRGRPVADVPSGSVTAVWCRLTC